MANGYSFFSKLHPAGGLYRYKGSRCGNSRVPADTWEVGKYYLLTKWETPEGIDKNSPIINAFFLGNGAERCVDISFFRYLEQVG